MEDSPEIDIHRQLNSETGKLSWPELQRHFARGVVIKVAQGQDLVDIASHFVKDNKPVVEALLNNQSITQANDHDAHRWHSSNAVFWAVVVAPWVLVQEIDIPHQGTRDNA